MTDQAKAPDTAKGRSPKPKKPRRAHRRRPPEEHLPVGRKTTYTPEIGEAIATHVAEGGSLIQWCKAKKGRPTPSCVYGWEQERGDFGELMARARLMQAESCLDLAVTDAAGATTKAKAIPARVRADIRMKVAQMRDPQRFGPRALPGGSVNVTITTPLGQAAAPSPGGGFVIDVTGTGSTQQPKDLGAGKPQAIEDKRGSADPAVVENFPGEEAAGVKRGEKP